MLDGDTSGGSASRRHFIKAAGVASVVGLAGCAGGDGGDGEDGGDGDGDGGDGGTTTQELTEITFTNFPINLPGAIWEYLDERTNILADEMAAEGYTANREASFEGPSLFFSGQADIATDLNTIEAARAGVNREEDLRVLDRSMSTFLSLMTSAGGEYDPRETGGVQESFQTLLDNQGRIGIFGWGVGDVPAYQIAADRLTDGRMAQDGGDYNVVSSDPAAIPDLIQQGELAAGASSATHGAGEGMYNEEIAPLMYPADFFAKQGWGTPSLENAVTRAEFLESDRGACEAIVRAYDQGTSWFLESALDDIPGDDSYMEKIGVSSADVAEYSIKWILGDDVAWQFDTDTPKLYDDVTLSQEWVDENLTFLNNAEAINQVPEGWQDRVEYVMDISA